MKFLRNVLATIVGIFAFIFLSIIVVAIIGAFAEDGITIKESSILHIKLNKPIKERAQEDPFSEVMVGFSGNLGLIDMVEAIENAKTDDKIKGIYLEPDYPMAGFASLEAIRNALVDFKESGKFITAYSEVYTEAGYYLASVADNIYMNPRGMFELNGLSANLTFFKGTFDKLGIEPEIFRVGDFKSAVEPFIRKDMSEANELQMNSILNSLYTHYLENVAAARSIPVATLQTLSDSMVVRKPEEALRNKLVTGVKYFDEVLAEFRTQLELEEDDKINFVGIGKYQKSIDKKNSSKNRIAVIVAQGDIVSGKGDGQSIGSDKFAKLIRKARENDKVKAIVLRVNSGGGGVIASDVIWREMMLAKDKKPVIASMGDYAASGGYYISMAADKVVAEPNTITGSIGIFMMLFNMEKFLEDKIGITHDVVKTGEYSDIITVTRSLNDAERAIFQQSTNEGYEDFTSKVAKARNMSIADVKKIASGRVWTGLQAKENGLVDEIGGLDKAIALAAEAAEISDDYKLRYYPAKKDFLEQIKEELGGGLEEKMMQKQMGDLYPLAKQIKTLKSYEGVQARLPFEITFE